MIANYKRYSEDEAREIIRRALTLQQRESNTGVTADALSLHDLETIGEDVGVSSDLVRRVAVKFEHGDTMNRPIRFFGASTSLVRTVVLDHPAGTEELDELLVALPSITGERGNGIARRSVLNWSSDALTAMRFGRSVHISVDGNGTAPAVHVREQLGLMAGGIFGGIMGGGGLGIGLGVGIGALGSALFSAVVPLLFPAGSYFLSRFIFNNVSRHRRGGVDRIARQIAEFLSRTERN